LDPFEGHVRVHHLLPGLRVIDARACAHRWVVFHESYDFCLVTNVARLPVSWKYNHRLYRVDPEHVMMAMQPGELHANVERTSHGDFIVVQIAQQLMHQVARELGWSSSALNIPHPHPATVELSMRRALEQFQASLCATLWRGRDAVCTCSSVPSLHAEHLVTLVAAFVSRCAEGAKKLPKPKGTPVAVVRAHEQLMTNYHKPYNLKQLAREAGASPYYLLHEFRRAFGISPGQLQRHVLVSKSCEALVKNPAQPLQTLANEVGWPGIEDAKKADTLIKHFRRVWGFTPDRFRHSLRGIHQGDWLLRAEAAVRQALNERQRGRVSHPLRHPRER
jgi:AraC-like DNA-binding protein